MRKQLVRTLLSTGVLLALGACSSSDNGGVGEGGAGGGGGTSATNQVEIYSWWISSGEAEALQALIDVNSDKYPNDRVFNAAKDSGDATRAELLTKIDEGTPPDLFQGNAYDLSNFVATRPDSLEPLDSLMADEGLDTAIIPKILEDVTVNGNIYAMPVNIHRENTLFYNVQIFSDNHLTPPTTVAEFLDVCATLKAAGITPVATGYQGWILRIMFNSLAMGSMGADAFNNYMAGGTRDDAAFGKAVDLMDNVLTNYVNTDAGDTDFGWTQAADAVYNGEAAMFFHGDWAKAYFEQLGWVPGTDFGVMGAPGATEMFWYGVDTFSMPKSGPNPDGAKRFLSTVGSKEGQVAFNKIKGSSPIRLDVPLSELDSEGRKTLQALQDATYLTFALNRGVWDDAWLTFATVRDKIAVMQVYADNVPPTK